MDTMIGKTMIFIIIALGLAVPLCAGTDAPLVGSISSCSFSEWVNNVRPQTPPVDDKQKLREYWKEVIGVDVFYTYFKAKELEDMVKEKGSITVLKVRGRPEIKNDSVNYIFRLKF